MNCIKYYTPCKTFKVPSFSFNWLCNRLAAVFTKTSFSTINFNYVILIINCDTWTAIPFLRPKNLKQNYGKFLQLFLH